MTAIVVLLLVITLSLTITRVAAVALERTGMSRDSARFQARAAYCGVGYSTRESEGVITHPVRRRIISLLMLIGNAGTATVVATLIVSFTGSGQWSWHMKLGLLVVGLSVLIFASNSSWVDDRMSRGIQWALKRWTRLDLHDYVGLLHLSAGFAVLEIKVAPGDWMSGKNLETLALPREGVLVLGIHRRDGTYVGAPTGKTEVTVDDVLIVYGKLERLEELNRRRLGLAGEYARAAAVSKHRVAPEATPPDD